MRTLLLTLAALPLTFAAWAGPISSVPTVVEMFTSKNCPSCPAAERYIEGWLKDQSVQPMVIFSHVDYWDAKALKPDPLSLAEATQRQYDYSNTLGRRPGEVFTPQPIINGKTMVKPSLRFNWPNAINAEMTTKLPTLDINAVGDSYIVTLPAGTSGEKQTLWLMGLDKDATNPVYHMMGLTERELSGTQSTITLPPEVMPKGKLVLVLLQNIGPGPVTASALIQK